MWNRQTESQTHRERRVSLVKTKNLTHEQIDRLFENEVKQASKKYIQETQKQTLRQRIEDLVSFEEWKSEQHSVQVDKILALIESEVEKRLEALNSLIVFYKTALEKITTSVKSQQEEYSKNISSLIEILKQEESRLKKDRAEYLQATKRTEKMYVSYEQEMQKANEVITTYNEKISELNKLIKKENRELDRLRRQRA